MDVTLLKAMSDLGGSITVVGILLAMLWYFIQRDKAQSDQAMKREEILSTRIAQLEDRYHLFAQDMITNATKIIASNTEALILVRRALGHERREHEGQWTKPDDEV